MRLLIPALALTAAAACTAQSPTVTDAAAAAAPRSVVVAPYSDQCITEQEVVEAQTAWSDGIVEIGRIYRAGGDYVSAASDHINRFYAYDLGLVLFKPTLAADEQFRGSFDGALSYFVGGNPSYPEDKGFALRPWTKVRWRNEGITNNSCTMAVAMGNYFFTAESGEETKVEYTIGYVKDVENQLRMVVHKSSLPYSGP